MGDIFGGGSSAGTTSPLSSGSSAGSNIDQLFANASLGDQFMGGSGNIFDATGITGTGTSNFDLSSLFGPASAIAQTTDPTGSVGATNALNPPSGGTQTQQADAIGGAQSAGAPAQGSQPSGGGGSAGGGGGGDKPDPQRESGVATLRDLLKQLVAGKQNPWVSGGGPSQPEATPQSPALAAQLAKGDTARAAMNLEKAGQLTAPLPPRTEGGETIVPQTTPGPGAPVSAGGPPADAAAPKTAAQIPQDAQGAPSAVPPGQGQPTYAGGLPGASPGLGGLPLGLAQLAILALGAASGRGGSALAPLAAAMLERIARPRPQPGQPGYPQPGAWRQQMDNFSRGPWASDAWHNTMVAAESSGRNSGSGRPEDGPAGDNGQSFGFFNIKTPTWNQYKVGVPGAEQYTRADQAPYAIQKAVADRMPIGIYGRRTRDILHRKFGQFDERTTNGALAQRFGGAAPDVAAVSAGGPPGATRPPKRKPGPSEFRRKLDSGAYDAPGTYPR
jgi:hypothetical protein